MNRRVGFIVNPLSHTVKRHGSVLEKVSAATGGASLVRLSDFDAPELYSPTGRADRDRLVRLVFGRQLSCVAVRGRNGRVVVYDRVIARCVLNGRGVGDLLRAAGGREGGN